jgi:hydroxymethylbilane synthase
MILRVGTRGSLLATTQTALVIHALRTAHPHLAIERIIIETDGDRRRESLLEIGGQGVFTKALEEALLENRIDVAVHSLKDLPSTLTEGLMLAATPPRAAVHDVLITATGQGWDDLPFGSRIGTGSLRRRAQLLAVRPDLVMHDIRGNVDTRLAKLYRGEYDAIILAAAGLERLGKTDIPLHVLPTALMLPAPAQGILGLECRADDATTCTLLAALNDKSSYAAALAERAVLRRFGLGCRLPIAALATVSEGQITVTARVLDITGQPSFEATDEGAVAEAESLGMAAADALAVHLPELSQAGRAFFGQGDTPAPAPLKGKRIVVTRARAQAEGLVASLESLGADVIPFPTIEIVPPADNYVALDGAITDLSRFDWVMFTSANAVTHFWQRLTHAGRDAMALAPLKVAAVGSATASALALYGVTPALTPDDYQAEGLLAALSDTDMAGQRVLLPRADIATDTLPQGLAQHGAHVTEIHAYRTIPPTPDATTLATIHNGVDAITFTSASSVRNFAAQVGTATVNHLAVNAVVAVIGPATAHAATEVGLTATVQAEPHTSDAMVQALLATMAAAPTPDE